MIKMSDSGPLLYGAAVTLADWWDGKRLAELGTTLTSKDVFKMAATWTYLGVGLLATLSSVLGWFRRYDPWMEATSHGFLYDLPRFVYNTAKSLGSGTAAGATSRAVREAQAIAQQKALGAGRRVGVPVSQTTKPEFENQPRIY
jgi:hypothetical protein